MAKKLKIEVCSHCSGFDLNELNGKMKVKSGCIGKCSKKHPELKGKVYGFLNGSFTVCDTKEEFFAKIEELDSFISNNKNPIVDEYLEHIEKWQDEHAKLRKICLSRQLTEEFKWGQPCYMLNDKNIVTIALDKKHIALSFFKGELLKDEKGMLVQQTKNLQSNRELQFKSAKEIDKNKKIIKAYIDEAIEVENGIID